MWNALEIIKKKVSGNVSDMILENCLYLSYPEDLILSNNGFDNTKTIFNNNISKYFMKKYDDDCIEKECLNKYIGIIFYIGKIKKKNEKYKEFSNKIKFIVGGFKDLNKIFVIDSKNENEEKLKDLFSFIKENKITIIYYDEIKYKSDMALSMALNELTK